MPRAKKTMAGTPGQPAQPITGQTYGEAKTQQMLQEAMPAPAVRGPQTPTTPTQAPQPQAQEQAQRPQLADVINMLRGQGGVLTAPDDQPGVPLTDGLSTGPGRGPEAVRTDLPLANTLRTLAMRTGDPVFYQLAAKVQSPR